MSLCCLGLGVVLQRGTDHGAGAGVDLFGRAGSEQVHVVDHVVELSAGVQQAGVAVAVRRLDDLLVPREHALAHVVGLEEGLGVEAPVFVGGEEAHGVKVRGVLVLLHQMAAHLRAVTCKMAIDRVIEEQFKQRGTLRPPAAPAIQTII